MMTTLKLYAVSIISFLVLDLIWIGIINKNFYLEQLRPIGRIVDGKFDPVIWAAILVYVVLAIGLVEFVMPKITSDTSFFGAFGIGALMGFVIYAVYDFTNYSTLKDWTIPMTFADIAWGTVLTGIVTLIVRQVLEFL